MAFRVQTFREAGLEAKWGHTCKGQPCISVRNPQSDLRHQRERWWVVTEQMWARAQEVGVNQAFDEHTIVGDVFSCR